MVRSYSLFFYYCSVDHPHLHSFPTRRSSDLVTTAPDFFVPMALWPKIAPSSFKGLSLDVRGWEWISTVGRLSAGATPRSEEHTSELQSLRHLVCRLLLEKKKKKNSQTERPTT